MKKIEYIIDDNTIAELLGIQNFTNSESAILELVKNAYDAHAENLSIKFNEDTLEIMDDGYGMNEEDIEKSWMYVGKSSKGYKNKEGDRILSGSKGIGRFAIAKLGKNATIYSKKNKYTGIIWETNWKESYVGHYNVPFKEGTKIIISNLREKWNDKRIQELIDFISRTYDDSAMNIKINNIKLGPYFDRAKLGINCLSIINIKYDALSTNLAIQIKSDEFKDEALKYCKDFSIKLYETTKNMHDEFYIKDFSDEENIELRKNLNRIGDFSAEFYFNNNPTTLDIEKFLYKHSKLKDNMGFGVILYRNAFSISSFEGKKDWLTFGKRARKSPAAASHKTGQWRVKENQISGKVKIDKKNNVVLQDLANRQGLEENKYYELFVDIILSGIDEFENFRQTIIKKIKTDENSEGKNKYPKTINKIVSNAKKEIVLPFSETKKIKKELDELIKTVKDDNEQKEKDYKYDVRILNTLSTIGLKAASIAHEMRNYNNSIKTIKYIISALKKYGMWEKLSSKENTQKEYADVPSLLNKLNITSLKISSFIEVMLTNIEKNKFKPVKQNVKNIIDLIILSWRNNYSWIDINITVSGNQEFFISEDILQVIFDNLILNSVQQNYSFRNSKLEIKINIIINNKYMDIEYLDMGNGLAKKYLNDTRKILKVHETTRENGHGLGMWIVNNTILDSNGYIDSIEGQNGFKIKFTIGEKYV